MFYVFSLIFLSGIIKSIYTLFQLEKIKVVDAFVIDSEPLTKNIVDENVNFLLKVKLDLAPDYQIIEVKGLYFRKLKPDEKVKVILDEKNISESKIFTGHESSSAWIQIFVLIIVLIFYIFFK